MGSLKFRPYLGPHPLEANRHAGVCGFESRPLRHSNLKKASRKARFFVIRGMIFDEILA